MAFDWTISLGDVVAIGGVIGALCSVYFKDRQLLREMRFTLDVITQDLGKISEQVEKYAERIGQLDARQLVYDQRLRSAEREINRSREHIHTIAQQLQVKIWHRQTDGDTES